MQGMPQVFIDVETTGGMAYSSRILEIGALRVEDGIVVDYIDQVLDPEERVPGWITELTGIPDAERHGKPTFAQVAPDLSRLLQGAVFIAHNVNFDYSFFSEEFRRLGQRFAMPRMCTVRLSRALFPAERSHRLDAVIARSGYKVAKRHRAFDDAEVLYKFYHDSLKQFGSERFQEAAARLLQSVPSPTFV
jgi:DNA polymerase III subunit epsilon